MNCPKCQSSNVQPHLISEDKKSRSETRLHTPKPGALPTALHPEICNCMNMVFGKKFAARFLLQLRLCRRKRRLLANRQVAATPYPSLHPPPAALGNVPTALHPVFMDDILGGGYHDIITNGEGVVNPSFFKKQAKRPTFFVGRFAYKG